MRNVLSYVLFGLFKGIIAQFTDLWSFLKISWSMEKQKRTDMTHVIDRITFEFFYEIVVNMERQGNPILAFDFIEHMRKLLEIENQIKIAIYGVDFNKRKANQAAAAAQEINP